MKLEPNRFSSASHNHPSVESYLQVSFAVRFQNVTTQRSIITKMSPQKVYKVVKRQANSPNRK